MSVEARKQRVVKTTTAAKDTGAPAVGTVRRISGSHSFASGWGFLDAPRAIKNRQTSMLDPGTTIATAGTAAMLPLALIRPLSV